jgi:CRISPR-associated protein Csy1
MSAVALSRLQALLAAGDNTGALQLAATCLRDPRLSLKERAEVLRARSIAHERMRDLPAALADIEKARTLAPQDARLCNEAGLLLSDLGRRAEALNAFQRAVTLDPRYARALSNLGTALKESGRLPDAVKAYEAAVAAKPDYALAWANLGSARRQLGLRDEAVAAIERALALEPNNKTALLALGASRRSEAAVDGAVDAFTAAVRVDPRDTAAWLQLAGTLAERDDIEGAKSAYARAQSLDPSLLRAILGRHLTLPMVSRDAAAMREAHAQFAQGLEAVASELPPRAAALSPERTLDELRWVNWLLPYHNEDARPLQERYAAIVGAAVEDRAPQWREPLARRARAGRRLRVGFLSGFFRDGTVGRYFQHWITDLPRDAFEVVVYHTTPGFDSLAQRLAARADEFRRCPLWSPAQLAQLVREDALDVLIYPELGLEPTTFALAALRLAPLQCAAWGHPVTTGIATIDVFFSSAEMEPPDAQAQYSERLVLLPGIGTRYARSPTFPDASRAAFGLPEDFTLLLCPQTHYKIHPDNDGLFARVLAANPDARLVIFQGRHAKLTATYLARLHAALSAHDVDRSRLIVLPTVAHDDYMRINAVCDAMLDTLHWSGGNTSLDALAAGLPIVTLPGPFMRGRQSLGMLRLMGLDDLVARDESDYLVIATRLAGDRESQRALRSRIGESAHRVFDDERPVAALSEFLLANA